MFNTSIPSHEYHAMPQLSSHQLMEFLRSPAHYKAALERRKGSSAAMEIGTCVHMAILEPEKFKQKLVYDCDVERRSAAGKAEYDAWLRTLQDDSIVVATRSSRPEPLEQITVTPMQLDNINGMREAFARHPYVQSLSTHDWKTEVTAFGNYDGVQLRSRFDAVAIKGDDMVLIDVKKTQDARVQKFTRDFYNYQYSIQMAFYDLVFECTTSREASRRIIIAIEEQYPHAIGIFEIPDDVISVARDLVTTGIYEFKQCSMLDTWPAYNTEPITLR